MRKVGPEEAFLNQIMEYAKLHGWRRAHFRPARTKHGWRTPVQGDGKGFLDLVLVRRHVLVWVETKSDEGRLTPEQEQWITALRLAGQDVRVWRPSQWEEIQKELY